MEAHFFRAGCVLRSKKTHLASVRIYTRSAFYVMGKSFHASAWQGLSYDKIRMCAFRRTSKQEILCLAISPVFILFYYYSYSIFSAIFSFYLLLFYLFVFMILESSFSCFPYKKYRLFLYTYFLFYKSCGFYLWNIRFWKSFPFLFSLSVSIHSDTSRSVLSDFYIYLFRYRLNV